jgi:hypothetical protein
VGAVADLAVKEMEKLKKENDALKEKLEKYEFFQKAFGDGKMKEGYVFLIAHQHKFSVRVMSERQAMYKINWFRIVDRLMDTFDIPEGETNGPDWIEKGLF